MPTQTLNILMLSWEFPPRIIGGISSHVNDLSIALTRRGFNVHVVTCDFPGAPEYEQTHGVHVYRFNSRIPAHSFLEWVFSMNQAMAEKAIDVINSVNEDIDLIHAHDWLVADAAIRVKNSFGKPLVSTIHATEIGRRGGIHNEYQKTINEVERNLINQSSGVICCSKYMATQVSETFDLPKEKLFVIPNGVDASKFDTKQVVTQAIKQRYAKKGERLVVYVGRLVYEKGVHVLIGAAPKVLAVLPSINFVIVGEGGMKEHLVKEAWDFGIADHVFFTGFVDSQTLISIYKAGDIAVFPSLYEPFGITVLEAMAAKTPVVVSDTGGLAEIVEHEKTGVKVFSDNSDSVAWGILRVLKDQKLATRIRENAYKKVIRDHDWNRIAEETMNVYRLALQTRPSSGLAMKLNIPFFKLEGYPEQMKVLVLLHLLAAVETGTARPASELGDMLGIEIARMRNLLHSLIEEGYVMIFRNSSRRFRYYLTSRGIIRACSLFS